MSMLVEKVTMDSAPAELTLSVTVPGDHNPSVILRFGTAPEVNYKFYKSYKYCAYFKIYS